MSVGWAQTGQSTVAAFSFMGRSLRRRSSAREAAARLRRPARAGLRFSVSQASSGDWNARLHCCSPVVSGMIGRRGQSSSEVGLFAVEPLVEPHLPRSRPRRARA